MKIKSFCLYALLLLSIKGFSQYSSDLSLGLGSMYYMGDIVQTAGFLRPGIGLQYRWGFNQWMSARVGILATGYGGDDEATKANTGRGLTFVSPLNEASLQFVFNILPEDDRGYNKLIPYVFAGGGLFQFNPKASRQGKLIALQPLGTEGQYIMIGQGKATPYRLVSYQAMGGLGVKYQLFDNLSVGFEAGYRKTFTDYMDDVSGNYADKDALQTFSGSNAVYFSDPTNSHNTGDKRGDDKKTDNYFVATFHFTYHFITRGCATSKRKF